MTYTDGDKNEYQEELVCDVEPDDLVDFDDYIDKPYGLIALTCSVVLSAVIWVLISYSVWACFHPVQAIHGR